MRGLFSLRRWIFETLRICGAASGTHNVEVVVNECSNQTSMTTAIDLEERHNCASVVVESRKTNKKQLAHAS